MKLLAIADDTTGALEVGAKFALAGWQPTVWIDVAPASLCELTIVDAVTRRLSEEDAAQRLAELAALARQMGMDLIYLKTDSTLRGPIALSFRIFLAAFPDHLLLYVPAYPAMGRTVVGGELFIHGIPWAETEFARYHPLQPPSSWIPDLLSKSCANPVLVLPDADHLRGALENAPAGSILVCDGQTDEDLEAIAQAWASSARRCLFAGPAGFAASLARVLSQSTPRADHGAPAPARVGLPLSPHPTARRWLLANGSRHPASRIQLQTARTSGVPVVTLHDLHDTEPALAQAVNSFAYTSLVAITTSGDAPDNILTALASTVRSLAEAFPLDALAIFGGSTALATFKALQISELKPRAEILPGVPLSWTSFAGRPLPVITKAGGFGPPDLVLRLKNTLENPS